MPLTSSANENIKELRQENKGRAKRGSNLPNRQARSKSSFMKGVFNRRKKRKNMVKAPEAGRRMSRNRMGRKRVARQRVMSKY